MVNKWIIFILVFFTLKSNAQNNFYFIGFKQKDTTNFNTINAEKYLSQHAIARRNKNNLPLITITDLPVDTHYINKILPHVNTFCYSLKWLNGIVVLGGSTLTDSLKKYNFIETISLIGYTAEGTKKDQINLSERINLLEQKFDKEVEIDSAKYFGLATEAIYFNQIEKLHQLKYQAQNTTIALIDGGFYKANQIKELNSNKIKGTFNIVDPDIAVFDTENDDHGLNVLSIMVANSPYQLVGSAPMAQYYLFHTENPFSEYPIEEYNWAKAAEIADSLGVDIITSSLGYTEFDDKQFGHKIKDLNGHKTIVAQAANLAASKGILVIVSAGNEGDKIWETISSPADADSVLAIGSCNNELKISTFSSVGFVKRNKIKPNLVTLGQGINFTNWQGKLVKGNGTSYATPLIAGGAACLISAFPHKNPFQIKQALHLSASNYFDGNKNWGYGIPNFYLSYLFLLPHACDTIIDITELSDQNIHIGMNSEMEQKMELTLQSADNKIVFKQKQKLVLGINRFALTKSYKLKPGIYFLKIKTSNTVLTKRIVKH
jgi:hypothetical protein